MVSTPQESARNPPETFALDRVRLRRPRLSDAEAIFAFGSDPEVARYADWPIRTSIEPLVESLRQRAELWDSGAEFYWVISLPQEDRAIGAISCCFEQHSAEYGFLLNRRYWGHGYATEASRTLVEWVLSVPGIWRIWATCDTKNLASVRVLEKSGLSREGILRRAIVRPNLSSDPRDAFIYSKVR
ncbi:MAG: GNAT family N-acetyltransferase [Candidatus Sericytochromatia bacterium]